MSAPTECSRETEVYYQNCARGTPTDDLVRPDRPYDAGVRRDLVLEHRRDQCTRSVIVATEPPADVAGDRAALAREPNRYMAGRSILRRGSFCACRCGYVGK